jgi:coenzyme Q-binding protein COQ10
VTTHSETRVVPYTADLMFSVVADVEAYPTFIPWVSALHVVSREHSAGRDVLHARMTVGFRSFKESYTSRVTLDRENRTIDVVQTDGGPFRQLENHWRFMPMGEQCRIDFTIAFVLRNPVLNAIAGAAFGRVLLRTQDGFLNRARELSKKLPRTAEG